MRVSVQAYSIWAVLVTTIQCQAFVNPSTCSAPSQYSKTTLFEETIPEPLAEEGTWQAFLDDETTGLIYYFDTMTGESLWEPPTETFPEIILPRKTQRLAEDLRRNYRRARQAEEDEIGAEQGSSFRSSDNVQVLEEEAAEDDAPAFVIPSWIGGLVEKRDEPEESVANQVPEEASQKDGWFGSFFSRGDKSTVAEAEPEEEGTTTNGGFFSAFGGLVGNAPTTTTTDDAPPPAVEKKVEPVVKPVQKQIMEEKKPIETKKATKKEVMEKKSVVEKKEKIVKDTKIAKDTNVVKTIKIEMGSHVLPHPSKVLWGGEDALFTKGRTFGVFDGVSGADKKDGLPLYSKTLANEMKKSVGKDGVSIKEMTMYLTEAADYADSAATGASTAVVASIGENGFLQALNVGDSMCMVVRNGKIAAKTREISHYWECPYQLSSDSPDRPRDGSKLNVELIPGDIVIMGSDGIFDNVNDDMLLETIGKVNKPNPTQLARKICDLSRKQSIDKNSVTPYGKQAQRRGDPVFKSGLGGKVDDASCIVVVCK